MKIFILFKSFLLVSLIFCCTSSYGQSWFKGAGSEVGVYYYPEQWPEVQWERDINKMAELGFEFIHLAEFSWSRLEPTEGDYHFEWLDKVIDLSARKNLKVILCTPSPCLPAWLSNKYPETLYMMETGQRVQHNGGRLTASLANPIYQKYVHRIVTQLGERYGKDPRIWGWQIGNEPHIEGAYDYSPSAQMAFQQWLKNKYKNVGQMNAAWGASFWSYEFNDFAQVKAPIKSMPGPNPHAYLDFQRYTSQEVANDLNRQADLLRTMILPNQWVTTNYAYFKFLPDVDPFLTRKSLDFSSHTMYLTSNWMGHSGDSLYHRLGSGLELSFSAEMAKSTHGVTGIMEVQPGQINWGRFNAMPLPGAVRMWIWHSIALGDEFVCAYRFRQPLFGGEQTHHGIIMTDGVTVNRGGQEFVQVMKELKKVESMMSAEAKTPPYIQATKTAFLWSFDNVRDLEHHKHHEDWKTWQHMYAYYSALKRMGVQTTFIGDENVPSAKEYPFLVVPAYQQMSRELIANLTEYVRSGGNLVLSTRSGLKDEKGHLWETKIQEPLWQLIGGEVSFYDHLPAQYPGELLFEKQKYPWHIWGEVVTPYTDTQSWAVYDDQFYKGKSATTHHQMGKGSVTFLGAWSDDAEYEYQHLRKLYELKVGALKFDLPEYVFVEWREGVWVAVNYTAQAQGFSKGKYQNILGNYQKIAPGMVAVFK